MDNDAPELPDIEYLYDLAERLRHVPAKYGTDDYDVSRLKEIASTLPPPPKANAL